MVFSDTIEKCASLMVVLCLELTSNETCIIKIFVGTITAANIKQQSILLYVRYRVYNKMC